MPAGLIGTLPGVAAARALPPRPLQLTIGLLVAGGVVATLACSRLTVQPTRLRTAATGLVSGFMSAAAGMGGAALAVYATATRWRQAAFVATAQLGFVLQSVLAVSLKGLPHFPWKVVAVLGAAVVTGLLAGHFLTRRIPSSLARLVVIAITLLAATATVVRALAN